MRVAIIYAGVIRRFRENYEHFKRAFLYDPHVEVHVYASTNIVNFADAMEFRALYNVKQMRIFEFDGKHIPACYDFIDTEWRWTKMNAASMFYHNKSVFELVRASGVEYDLIIKARTDFCDTGQFPYMAVSGDGESIFVPGGISGSVNDQVACGSFKAMERYCSLWDRLEEYCKKDGVRFHPETVLGHHLTKNQWPGKNLDFHHGLDGARHPPGWTEKTK